MVLKWLEKLLGGKTKSKHTHLATDHPDLEHSSLHTMGPEELLDAAEQPIENMSDLSSQYEEIAPVHHGENDSSDDEMEPVLEVGDNAPQTKKDALKIIEAALYMSSKGSSLEELGKMANIPLLKTRQYIPELIEAFNRRDSALEIVEDVGGYRMKVRAPYDEKVSHLAGASELSPGEMKTLAFIAYKQPLVQSQLVQVRSNTAYDHLAVLVEKGFVSREPKGRTYLLRTTKKFSEYFGAHALKLRSMKKDENMADQ